MQRMPRRPRSRAKVSPTGPAPTMRTCVSLTECLFEIADFSACGFSCAPPGATFSLVCAGLDRTLERNWHENARDSGGENDGKALHNDSRDIDWGRASFVARFLPTRRSTAGPRK